MPVIQRSSMMTRYVDPCTRKCDTADCSCERANERFVDSEADCGEYISKVRKDNHDDDDAGTTGFGE